MISKSVWVLEDELMGFGGGILRIYTNKPSIATLREAIDASDEKLNLLLLNGKFNMDWSGLEKHFYLRECKVTDNR